MAIESLDKFAARLQARLCPAGRLELDARPKELYGQMRGFLVHAFDTGQLASAPAEIHTHLKYVPDDGAKGRSTIAVGGVNQDRVPTLPHLRRDDGAWFDFGLTVESHGKGCRLLSYRYEIRFPLDPGMLFLRLDLNPPDHANTIRELRSHLHPGDDDLQLPAPVLAPIDALQIMVHGLRRPTDRKPRVKGVQ